MFRKSDKPAPAPTSMPAWERGHQEPAAPNLPAFAAATQTAHAEKNKDVSAYDLVVEDVKQELKTSRRLPPSAYDNPTDQDYATVTEVARRMISSYNINAPSKGQPLLIEGAEDEAASESERIAKRITEDVLGWGPIA
ncbi:MAG TPA: hypothetical protein VGK87_16380, partial [Anaerolineae bacterium]